LLVICQNENSGAHKQTAHRILPYDSAVAGAVLAQLGVGSY
jgi:hypothetical protein